MGEETPKKTFKIISEEDIISAQAVLSELDPMLKRRVMWAVHKTVHAIDSYGKYAVRRQTRNGIYLSYNSEIMPLTDGYRITIEVRVVGIDSDLFKKRWRIQYYRATDHDSNTAEFRKFDRDHLTPEEVMGEDVGGSEGEGASPNNG